MSSVFINSVLGAISKTFKDLTVTGFFTSRGIDDNATTTQLTLTDIVSTFGADVEVTELSTYGISAAGLSQPITDKINAPDEALTLRINSATEGGTFLTSISDGASRNALIIRAYFGVTNPTDTISALEIRTGLSDGSTGTDPLGATDRVLTVTDDTGATEYFVIFGSGDVTASGGQITGNSVKVGSFTVATLPSASGLGAGAMIYVTDEVGGSTGAESDATNWRRYADRAIVS